MSNGEHSAALAHQQKDIDELKESLKELSSCVVDVRLRVNGVSLKVDALEKKVDELKVLISENKKETNVWMRNTAILIASLIGGASGSKLFALLSNLLG